MQLPLSSFARQLSNARLAARGVGGRVVHGVTHDARCVEPGVVFCLLPESRGAHPYQVFAAAERGAAAVICEPDTMLPPNLPRLEVADAHTAYAEAASALFGNSAQRLELFVVEAPGQPVPGTRRHSSNVACLLARLLRATGREVALLGELGCETGDRRLPRPVSRLDALELHSFLAQHERAGGNAAVIELAGGTGQNLAGRKFAGAVALTSARPLAADTVLTWRGLRLPVPEGFLLAPLAGRGNALALREAFEAALAAGAARKSLVAALKTLRTTSGFLEPVHAGQPFGVFLDAAQTVAELATVLTEARELVRGTGRLLLVTGAPAEVGAATRIELGRAAATADRVIVTADNPRHESVTALSAQMMSAAPAARFVFEPNRERAVQAAIRIAGPDDVVVIAGKAHRRVQEIGGAVLPCDDQATAISALAARGYRAGGTEL
ncbi:MAG TPA: cyanophycin synthetase [Candidatus Limnocylindria bacterium]|nr:cyanophycin synthetase [Candidatus Limnocylindria bacterium]